MHSMVDVVTPASPETECLRSTSGVDWKTCNYTVSSGVNLSGRSYKDILRKVSHEVVSLWEKCEDPLNPSSFCEISFRLDWRSESSSSTLEPERQIGDKGVDILLPNIKMKSYNNSPNLFGYITTWMTPLTVSFDLY